VRWCPDGELWRFFGVLYLQRATCSRFQTCILNSHWGHAMCRSMVDIQSVAAEIRRGIKKEEEDRRKKLQGKNIMAPLLHRAAINSLTWDKQKLNWGLDALYDTWHGKKWAYYEHTGVHTGLRAPLTLTAKITGTMHTSAKERLTSSAVWQISMNEWPVTTFRISQYWSPPKFSHLFIGPLPTFPENFMQICSEVFAQSC